jgi:hypothetical protein
MVFQAEALAGPRVSLPGLGGFVSPLPAVGAAIPLHASADVPITARVKHLLVMEKGGKMGGVRDDARASDTAFDRFLRRVAAPTFGLTAGLTALNFSPEFLSADKSAIVSEVGIPHIFGLSLATVLAVRLARHSQLFKWILGATLLTGSLPEGFFLGTVGLAVARSWRSSRT